MSAIAIKLQSGRTIMEMLCLLAIAGILSVVGIAGYSMAMEKYKTGALIDKVNVIAQQARNVYKKGNYSDFNISNLVAINRIQDNNNPFGGHLLSGNTGDSQIFSIYTEQFNVPTAACIAILRTNWGDNGMFYRIRVKTYAVPPAEPATQSFDSTPVAAGTAANVCLGDNKQIEWILK